MSEQMSELQQAVDQVKQSVNVPVQNNGEEKSTRGFAGFKCDLALKNGRNLHCRIFPVRQAPPPSLRYFVDVDGIQVEVFRRYVPISWDGKTQLPERTSRKAWLTGDNSVEFPEAQVKVFQEDENGQLVEAQRIPKTKLMEEEKRISMAEATLWFPEEIKQVVADLKDGSAGDMLALAKELQATNSVIVAHYSNGGSEMDIALLHPWFMAETNQFSILMYLTRANDKIALDKAMSMNVQRPVQTQFGNRYVRDVNCPKI